MKDRFQALLIIAIAGGALFTVLAVSGSLSVSCGCGTSSAPLPGCVEAPCPAREMLVMESYKVNSPTNLTMTLQNTGWIAVDLVSYKVTDSSGAYFANTTWTGPTVNPNQAASANILIDGKAFNFQTGPTYTITVVTSRTNIFTFTVS